MPSLPSAAAPAGAKLRSLPPVSAAATSAELPLSALTTLRVGGRARRVLATADPDELLAAVREVDAAGEPLLLVAGGSNLVVGDDGFAGTAVRVCPTAAEPRVERRLPDGDVVVRIAAGVPWDGLVEATVAQGWAGLEPLSGIPGSTGATPVQNVGAYGAEVAETVERVRVYDRVDARVRLLSNEDCRFGYRDSALKQEITAGPGGTDRYVVLDVDFRLRPAARAAPVRYAQLATALGVAVGEQVSPAQTRETVLALRRSKAMVLDEADHDTWSVGSFFTNPIVGAAEAAGLPAAAPRWPLPDGRVKIPAAWLIEHAGISRGHGLPGPAAVSTRHTLALTNRGSASAADVLALARELRAAVEAAFGIRLVPEPRLVGVTL